MTETISQYGATPARSVDFTLYLITDRHRTGGRDLLPVVEAALMGGVRGVQLREKDLPAGELYALALRMRELTARYGARLFINDRLDVALATKADGVHLGEAALPVAVARRVAGRTLLLGASRHSVEGALEAQAAGADFITFGPVFPTPSKLAYGEPVGLGPLRQAIEALSIPVYPLGGIGPANMDQVLARGAVGIALVSAILAAPCAESAARELLGRISPSGSTSFF
jgi:thiamine-phosphate pyrophosphorylase